MANTRGNKIVIDTGVKSLDIIRDGENVGVFRFNPSDYDEAMRHAGIVSELEEKQSEYITKAKALDESGTAKDKVDFLAGFTRDMRDKIDSVYGDGTSDMLFGDALVIEAVLSFFNQLKPFYAEASTARKQSALKK